METVYNVGFEVSMPPNGYHITGETKLISQRQQGLSAEPFNRDVIVLSKYQGLNGPHAINTRTIPFLNQEQLFAVASKMANNGVIDLLSLTDSWPLESYALPGFLADLPIPVIWEVATMDFFGKNFTPHKLSVGHLVDQFVTVSKAIATQMYDAGIDPAKIEIIHPPVDTDLFYPADQETKRGLRQKLGIRKELPVGIYAGRFNSQKGIDFAIRSWPRVSDVGGQLLLLGSAVLAERAKYEQLINEHRNVISPGFIASDAAKAEYFRAADYFIIPSHSEGLSIAMLEAMACGLPVVASAEAVYNSGLGEAFIEDVTGVTFPYYSTQELKHAVSIAISKKGFYGRKGREFIETYQYDLKSTLSRLDALYSNLVNGSPYSVALG